MQEIWTVFNKAADFHALAEQLKVDPVLVRIMRNRDLTTYEQMAQYLGMGTKEATEDHLLKDMQKAVDILREKLCEGARIRIISDYDVDGICSNYVLYTCLQELLRGLGKDASQVDYVIPHRIRDGYGLNAELIKNAQEEGVDTILTCDNGIAAVEEIALAKKLQMTVIVTDHHEAQQELPDADAIVDPKQPGCGYPFVEICGAVVAFKVMKQLYVAMGREAQELDWLYPYLAMATVCDVMVLQKDNRDIVKRGISMLQKKVRERTLEPGLLALIEVNQLEPERINAYSFGFTLGPCLNAMGRLSSAKWGLKLLLETDEKKAEHRAQQLKRMNELRQEMSKKNETLAIHIADSELYRQDAVLVLHLPDCHESIAGIVAGRVREHTGKPTLLLTNTKEKGIVKGSGRSIPEYDMFAALMENKDCFLKVGGHKMAAGFTLEEAKLPLLRKRLNESANLSEEDLARKYVIDLKMPVEYIGEAFVKQLSLLEPTGNGNSRALFAEKHMTLTTVKVVGKRQNVLRLNLLTPTGKHVNAVYFGAEPFALFETFPEPVVRRIKEAEASGRRLMLPVSILYQPTLNEYMGNVSVELKLISAKYEE